MRLGGSPGKEEKVRKYILLCALMLGFTALASPGGVIFILDASNSMNISFQGMPRIQWAKDALGELVMELPDEMPFGLVVFGHRIPKDREPESCRDVELALEMGLHGADVRAEIVQWVQGLKAQGKTPLAYALEFAAGKASPPCRIVLITDGMETCGGDPVGVARDLAAGGCVVDVVGLAVKPEEEDALRELAVAGGGRFWRVEELGSLLVTLREVLATPATTAPPVPPMLACYNVDPEVVKLLLAHLPYPVSDPMWCVILRFLERNPPDNVVVGSDGPDTLFGTHGNDIILGLGGSDRILGFGGNDLLVGGPCNDIVQGGDGSDLILGGPGNDVLLGGVCNDVIFGEDGSDRMEGEEGNDALYGGRSDDTLLGGPGCNYLDGGPGDNFLYDEGACPSCAKPKVRLCAPCGEARPPEMKPSPCAPTPKPPTCERRPEVSKVVDEGQCIPLKAKVYDPDCNIASVTWRANAGSFSDPHSLETTWCAPMVSGCEGQYVTVTLEAVDTCGAKSASSVVIYVRNVNHPPRVDAGPDLVVDEGGSVTLQASAMDPDGDPLTYTWTIGCNRGSLNDPSVLNPIFTAPLTTDCQGEYVTLTLTVRDACGAVAKDTVRVYVRNVNHAPWVDAGDDLMVQAGQTVRLCARAGDPDGEAVRVFWTIIQGEGAISDPNSLVTSYTAPMYRGCEPREVKLAIRAVDPCGADAVDYLTITVIPVNEPPRVEVDP